MPWTAQEVTAKAALCQFLISSDLQSIHHIPGRNKKEPEGQETPEQSRSLGSTPPLTMTHGRIDQGNSLLKLFQFSKLFPSLGENFLSAH